MIDLFSTGGAHHSQGGDEVVCTYKESSHFKACRHTKHIVVSSHYNQCKCLAENNDE